MYQKYLYILDVEMKIRGTYLPTIIKVFILECIEMITRPRQRGVTVRELAMYKLLQTEIGVISVSALDRILRHYYRQGLLKRYGKGHRYDPYRYVLSNKGLQRLDYLKIHLGDAAITMPIEIWIKRRLRMQKGKPQTHISKRTSFDEIVRKISRPVHRNKFQEIMEGITDNI